VFVYKNEDKDEWNSSRLLCAELINGDYYYSDDCDAGDDAAKRKEWAIRGEPTRQSQKAQSQSRFVSMRQSAEQARPAVV
jgi:hypothetical protein